jgi:antitoxin HigA-1
LTIEPRTATDLPAMHPGELLREEILPALGRPRTEIAQLLGVSRQALHSILTERASVTPEMALRLGKLCGNGPELRLALQTRYDLDACVGRRRPRSQRSRPCRRPDAAPQPALSLNQKRKDLRPVRQAYRPERFSRDPPRSGCDPRRMDRNRGTLRWILPQAGIMVCGLPNPL